MIQSIQYATTFDEAMDALSAASRRSLLFALEARSPDSEGPVSLADVVDETDGEQLINFHHKHMPKLVGYGYVEWQDGRDVVERGPAFDEIRPLLELLRANEGDLPDQMT